MRRPLSVWVLTILDGILAALLVATALIAENRGYSTGQAMIAGAFGLAISLASHATWFGYRKGRLALLVLVTVFLGLVVVQSAMWIAWALDTGYDGPALDWTIVRAGLSLVFLMVNYAGLYGKRARMFFA